jgi:protein SCO1/2
VNAANDVAKHAAATDRLDTPAVGTPSVGNDPTDGLIATFATCLAVLLVGLLAIFQATAGGTAYTTETLRRSEVAQAPVLVPNFQVVDAQGQQQALRDVLAQDGRVWIVDFVYTRCMTLCLALGTVFQQLQAQVLAQGLQDRVGLLSISFDPVNDQPPALAAYAQRMRMQTDVWQLLSLAEPQDRRRLLDSFGIMVVPAPLGEFEHNAALHLVTADGRLVRILGLEEGTQALVLARALAQASAPTPPPVLALAEAPAEPVAPP